MRNKVVKKLLMIAMAVTMISGTSIATVYANANPPAEETTTQVVEETAKRRSQTTIGNTTANYKRKRKTKSERCVVLSRTPTRSVTFG